MTAMTLGDSYSTSGYQHISGYFTVMRDLMFKIQTEVEHHQEVTAICKTLDTLTEITETAELLAEKAFEEQIDISLPVEAEVLFNCFEQDTKQHFEMTLSMLDIAEFPWHTKGKKTQLEQKLISNRDSLLRLVSLFQKFHKADEWDFQVMKQAYNGELDSLLQQNPIVFTRRDWETFIGSLDEDDFEPSPKMKETAKSYRTLLSA